MDNNIIYYTEIEKKLDLIAKNIEKDQWSVLSGEFLEIKKIKDKIGLENVNTKDRSEREIIEQKKKILSKINKLEQTIILWKEKQQEKINNIKTKENHLNGYKKQPNRPYYIDKSE